MISNNKKELGIGLVVLFAGFLTRWIYVLALDVNDPLRGDAASYFYYARNLLDYGIFSRAHVGMPVPDSYWAPGYPFFLAICFKLADYLGVNFYPVVLFAQTCLGGAIAQLTYHTGRFFLSIKACLFAVVLVIVSPHLNSLGGYFITETLFAFLLLLSIFVTLKAMRFSHHKIYWLFAGLCWGAAYLTNPIVLFLPFIIASVFLLGPRKDLRSRGSVAVLLISFISVVGSWQIRDWVSVEEGQESTAGRAFVNLVIGAHSDYHAVWRANIVERQHMEKLVNKADVDIEAYQNDHPAFYRELLERIRTDPARYAHWYFIGKPMELWGWNILAGEGDIYQYPVNTSLYHQSKIALVSLVLMKQLHPFLICSALLGVCFIFHERNPETKNSALHVCLTVIVISAIYIILHTDGRYSVPMRPELYLCAAYGLSKLFELLKPKRT